MSRQIPGGFYMAIEGPDGCGKSTQYRLLADRLAREYEVFRTHEPGGTPFCDAARSLLLDSRNEDLSPETELFMFCASRRHAIENLVTPNLALGKIVLTDRCFYSTEAYQGAAGKIDPERIRQCNQWATAGADLGLAVILDLDPKIGIPRAKVASKIKDKIEGRALEYHRNVWRAYQNIAKRDKEVCVLVDASKSIEEIHDVVYRATKERIDMVLKDA